MRVLSRCLPVLLGIALEISCVAQSWAQQVPAQPQTPPWTLLMDPVCPVAPHPGRPNATKELRVLYFPSAEDAKLKDSKSLSLQVGLNGPNYIDNDAVLPFSRKGDHWEAVLPLDKRHASYAIFYVKDDDTNAVDDNAGKYWDMVPCTPLGDKELNGLMMQAESYSGEAWPSGIRREKDLDKVVSLLESAIANSNFHTSMALTKLWEYKAKRDGDSAAAYAKLATEIGRYLDEHIDDANAQFGVGNFVANNQRLPPEFADHTVARIDAKIKEPGISFRAALAVRRAEDQAEPHKRLAALDQVIAQYPKTLEVVNAYLSRFFTCLELKDVPCAEAALANYREASQQQTAKGVPDFMLQGLNLQMAALYAQQGVKLDAALKLTDEAEASSLEAAKGGGNDEIVSSVDAQIAETRARVYLGMHNYDLAVQQAQKAIAKLEKNAETHFILAQAFAGAGQKSKALDEYFNAALMPSNSDLEYRAELQHFYLAHFGNEKQFEVALHQQITNRFQAANYVPKLLKKPAPKFGFTTLKGETFDSAQLNGKIVVINFWSPG